MIPSEGLGRGSLLVVRKEWQVGVRGRIWLLLGVLVGVGIAIGRVPYFAGTARSFADDVQRVVGTGAAKLISSVARHGASKRVVLGVSAVLAMLLPGITALLLVVAARGTLRLRALIGALIAALGVASFAYQPGGKALGVTALALLAAAAAVALSGPLLIVPLGALAGLIGGEFLPRLVRTPNALPRAPILELHQALFGSSGSPLWLHVVVLALAMAPFAFAARLVVK